MKTHDPEKTSLASTPKILVVDDDLRVAEQIRMYLSEAGYLCDTCLNPKDALRRIKSAPGQYELIFMDFQFGENVLGREAASSIAAMKVGTSQKTIGMTGCRDLYCFEDRSVWGMCDVIFKPLHKWLVINLVKEHLS